MFYYLSLNNAIVLAQIKYMFFLLFIKKEELECAIAFIISISPINI